MNSSLIISGSRFEVLVCTTCFVVARSVLLVARHRGGTLSTIIVAAVAARPAAVVVVATKGLDAWSAKLLAKVDDGNLNLGEVLKGNEELCVCGSAVGGECNISCSESCYWDAITGSGCRKVGDGFDRFILIVVIGWLIGVIGQLEDGTSRGGLWLLPFLVGSCEEVLEEFPGLVVSRLAPSEFSVVIEESVLEQELESDCDNLGRVRGRF